MTPPPSMTQTPKPAAEGAKTDLLAAGKTPPPPATSTRTVQIPLTGTAWAMLQVPFPMTPANWTEMEEFLKLMKRPLTEG